MTTRAAFCARVASSVGAILALAPALAVSTPQSTAFLPSHRTASAKAGPRLVVVEMERRHASADIKQLISRSAADGGGFPQWPGSDQISPDRRWFAFPDVVSDGGNLMRRTNAWVSHRTMHLRSQAHSLDGAEMASTHWHYRGYYEARVKVTSTPGVCTAFFWFGPLGEVDLEFLTNEPWLASRSSGIAHLSVHLATGRWITAQVSLPFNPSRGFHRFGFLIGSRSISWYADDQRVAAATGLPINLGAPTTPRGEIKASTWTGTSSWGGGPPDRDAVTEYRSMRFWNLFHR